MRPHEYRSPSVVNAKQFSAPQATKSNYKVYDVYYVTAVTAAATSFRVYVVTDSFCSRGTNVYGVTAGTCLFSEAGTLFWPSWP